MPAGPLPPGGLADAVAGRWRKARRGVLRALPRADRDTLDGAVHALIGHRAGQVERRPYAPPPGPDDVAHAGGLVTLGADTAALLARHGCTDPETLAVAVLYPWYERDLGGHRPADVALPAGGTGRAVAALLALAGPDHRNGADPADRHSAYLRQLAALPAAPRAVALAARHLAARRRSRVEEARPRFGPAELAALSDGLPPALLAELHRDATAGGGVGITPVAVPPVGSGREAIEEILRQDNRPTGGIDLIATGAGLDYLVGWDAPADAVYRARPPVTVHGGTEPVRFDEPGWRVDRVTRFIGEVDLACEHGPDTDRRLLPLPAGWAAPGRPAPADGIRADAAGLPATVPAMDALAGALDAVTARYTAALAGDRWPDLTLAWRTGLGTAQILLRHGVTDPETLLAALLAARDPAGGPLLPPDAPPWRTGAGALAGPIGPLAPDTDPADGDRLRELAGRPAAVRALVVADALSRATVETGVFGVLPEARRAELLALAVTLPGLGPLDAEISALTGAGR